MVTVIEDALAAWLRDLPAVRDDAGGRVYPWAGIPQNTAWPLLAYHLVDGQRLRSLTGPSGVGHSRLQIDALGLKYPEAKGLADAVRVALEGDLPGQTIGGKYVQSCIVHGARDESTPPPHGDEVTQFRVCLDLTIWFVEG